MSMAPFFGVPGKLKTLIDRLTPTRAANLDNLNATISSRAPESTALSSSIWTNPRAINLDNLNTTVSSRATQASVDVVDANVDSILAKVNTIPSGSIVRHAEVDIVGVASSGARYTASLGATFDEGKSIVQVSIKGANGDPDPWIPHWHWETPSEIRVIPSNMAGNDVSLTTARTVKVVVVEFAQ